MPNHFNLAVANIRAGKSHTLRLKDENLSTQETDEICKLLTDNVNVKELSLTNTLLSDESCAKIVRAAASNTHLRELGLADNRGAEQTADAVTALLRSQSGLNKLNLYYNKLGTEGAERIAEALPEATQLTHLNLGYNEITDQGVKLAEKIEHNHSLVSLSLEGVRASDASNVENAMNWIRHRTAEANQKSHAQQEADREQPAAQALR